MTNAEPSGIGGSYPSNSKKSKENGPPAKPEKFEKVISGVARERKKPLGRRIAESFTGDDAQSVGGYILFDIALPALKNLIVEAISSGAERLFMGESYRPSGGGRTRQGYNTMYNRNANSRDQSTRPPGTGSNQRSISNRGRATHDFREIVLDNRGDAEEVLDLLRAKIEQYGSATVTDLYDLVDITGSFADDKWGWFDLKQSGVRRINGGGYLLELPPTEELD